MLSSVHNARVKDVVRLRDRRHRRRAGRFLIEGRRELDRAADAGFPLLALYHCPAFHAGRGEAELVRRFAAAGAACEETSAAVFEKMSYRRTPDGLIGVAATPSLSLDALPASSGPVPSGPVPSGPASSRKAEPALWLVAVGIEKPGNLGAMLRSVDAGGASGLLVADPVADVFNPNAVRASLGALFCVPTAAAAGGAIGQWLRQRGIRMVGASPQATTPYTAADLRGDVALVVGSESAGLNAPWLANAAWVSIPMAGRVDSLNTATAAALLLFEARRQRAS